MLALYLAEQLVEGGRGANELRLRAFLKVEQLCGYARWQQNQDSDLRGIREVQRRLDEQKSVTISADSAGQILSNQKTYGLWGLYTDPSRKSGFVDQQSLVLTPDARTYVETTILPVLAKARAMKRLEDIVRRERSEVEPSGRDKAVFVGLGETLVPRYSPVERRLYREHLVLGRAGQCAAQERFAELLESTLPKGEEFSHSHLATLIRESRRHKHEDLVQFLEDIRDLEALLIPLADLFGFLQARDGAKLDTVVKEVRAEWPKGLSHIDPEAIAELKPVVSDVYGDGSAADRLTQTAEALRQADLGAAVQLCLAHNAFVMQARGGAQPWVVVSSGRLDVRYRDDQTDGLRPAATLAKSWRSGFYINPLKNISDQLRTA